jgi:hypothetical protein
LRRIASFAPLSVRPFTAGSPAANTASADFSLSRLRRDHPFRCKARSPQIRRPPFAARPPDLRRLIFDHKSFAVNGPLALVGSASYPVSVRRPAASLHASFPRSVALPQLRFASIAMVSFWEDFHLQGVRHAGRTAPSLRRNPEALCFHALAVVGRVAGPVPSAAGGRNEDPRPAPRVSFAFVSLTLGRTGLMSGWEQLRSSIPGARPVQPPNET